MAFVSSRRRSSTRTSDASLPKLLGPIHDFASFMMFFNDVFMNDEFYINFGMTDDLMMSNVVGEGAQFEVKRFRLSPHMSVRTSNEASSRLTGGREVILKRPKLVIDSNTHKFKESAIIENVVQELRVISHPSLRHHRNILDVYGFAWEQEHYVPGVAVWPIIMVEFGELGTLDDCLSQSVPLNLDTKLRLAGDIAAGVDALHSCGIIHSDLKPENIIVCQTSDGTLIAKLSDFGYSIILGERESPSLWDTGTDGWMAPGWPLICENEELFSSDIYSCGLLLWAILLNGISPWELDAFDEPKVQAFEAMKRQENGLTDFAIGTVLETGDIPEERIDEITPLLVSLLGAPSARTLEGLLQYVEDNNQEPSELSGLPLSDQTNSSFDDRPMFPDVQELQDLPLAVQYQILDSMSKIATDPEQEQARRADACYVVAILHIQHIGTVHPRTSQSKEYTGYDIDVDQVLSWMKRGAELGSPGARSVYSQVRSACAGETDYYSVPQETLISWLTNATTLGSHIAAKCLKELDQSAWKEADEIFRTEYCGVGRKLFEDKLISYRYVPMVSLAASQISQKLENSNNTLLHLAATTGREDVVRQLCGGASYAQVNTTNVRNETPLFQATRSGHQGIVNYLLSVGASAAISSSNGENPLHWLAAFNIDELELTTLARSLIEGGADIEQMSTDNRIFNQHFRKSLGPGTPLCRAVQRDSFIAARVLIALDANPYSGEDNFPMALACSSHNSQLIGLLLSSPHPIRLPGWYNKPFLFDPEHSFEAIRAKWNKAPTFQSAAPNAWKSMEERGSESSLLGYAVAPNLLYSRMALHGSSYEDQMKLTIQQLSMLEYQDFSRVSFDYESAVMRSVISRDVSIVSYLLSSFPDEAIPTLTNPLPTGRGAHLPAQLALSMGEKPIFKVLLKYASPTAPVGVPNMQGVTDNLFARTALQLFTKRTTIATTKVSVMFKNLVQLAVAAHPDPEFMESILEPLDPEDAKALVNSHGPADEIPFTMAVGRHFFDVAEVLLKYGADIEEEGNKPANNQGFGRSPLGVLISLNNHGTSTAVAWLLQFNPSFLVNKQFELSALDMAIRAGGPYEMSADEPTILFPMRLYKFNGTVLRLLLEKFGSPEQLNHQCEGFWGMTALHWAVFRLCPEAVRILLDAGADTNIKIVIPGSKLPPLTAQELAMDLDESLVPETVKKRGDKEIKRYLRRIEDVQREFLDHLGATM